MPAAPVLETWRCPGCATVLAKLQLAPGSVVEILCKRCKTFSIREQTEQRIATYR